MTLTLKREIEYTVGSLFQRQKSCIGLLSRAQVCSYTAHKRAFLLAPGRKAPHRGEGFCRKRRRPKPYRPLRDGSEHDLEERSDAQIIVSRFPVGGDVSEADRGGCIYGKAAVGALTTLHK